MPSKRKKAERTAGVPEVRIPPELLDELVKGPMTAAEVESVCRSFKQAFLQRAMGAGVTQHLGYGPGEAKPDGQANHRNGTTGKTVLTDDGEVRIEVPRERDGSFEPQIIPKHARRFTGFDDKIVAMYARGMTVREIRGFLAEMYGTEVSPDFISQVTDEVMAEVIAWRTRRPLEPMCPVIFFDALRVKVCDDGVVAQQGDLSRTRHPARRHSRRAFWPVIEQTEGAKFWLKVFNGPQDPRSQRHPDRRSRLGLKDFAEAIEVAFSRRPRCRPASCT